MAGGCNDNAVGTASRVSLNLAPFIPYMVMVSSAGSGGGSLTFRMSFQAGPPLNDDCEAASVLSNTWSWTNNYTAAATVQTTDPTPGCGNGSRAKSVWYQTTAPGTGTVTVKASEYESILSAYTGSCGDLTPVPGACNDNSGCFGCSEITFAVTHGVTYYIMVTARNADGGYLVVSHQYGAPAAPNDTCTAASEVQGFQYYDRVFGKGGISPSDPTTCGEYGKVWYRWTAPAPGTVETDSSGSSFYTALSAWTGGCGQLTEVAGTCGSGFTFRAEQGVTYWFSIAGTFPLEAMVSEFSMNYLPDAGRVPDGSNPSESGLVIVAEPGGSLTLTWEPSCLVYDIDYEIYEGIIGDWYSHAPMTCSTGGANSVTVSPSVGDTYYLVVPSTGTYEGSYGLDSNRNERSAGTAVCLTQSAATCGAVCEHDRCVEGDPLPVSCDPCVARICADAPSCCTGAWDATCVGLVDTVCGSPCP